MSLLSTFGLIKVNEHQRIVKEIQEYANGFLNRELEKRNMLVDEALNEVSRWTYNTGDLVTGGHDFKVSFTLPRSLVLGFARGQPDVASFCVDRVAHLLRGEIQKILAPILRDEFERNEEG